MHNKQSRTVRSALLAAPRGSYGIVFFFLVLWSYLELSDNAIQVAWEFLV